MTLLSSTSTFISDLMPGIAFGSKLTQDAVASIGRVAGFSQAGIVSLPHPDAATDAARFSDFILSGRAGSMEYLARKNEQGEFIRSDCRLPFPWARSVVVCMASYHSAAPLSTHPADSGAAWIARYAWSGQETGNHQTGAEMRPSDYHKVLLKRLQALETGLHRAFGAFECRAYVDTGPIVERSAARAAGLGWVGKNTCLIHPKAGSWNFLAVLVTSLEVPPESAPLAVPDRCGSCRRCIEACPTQALVAPYQMDASRCISYLTIEHRGEIAEDLLGKMGRQVFGCDICQDVCPWNRKAPIVPESGLETENHPGLATRRELVNPPLDWLADLSNADFERIFNASPVRRTGIEGLRRNLAIAMGNSGLARFIPLLESWAAEPSPTEAAPELAPKAAANLRALRVTARWALNRLIG